ncbi:hypothetical protein [Psychroserpens sp. SPM9]|uniref:hypothetical protein n=1 Tax=Psychroserpens sp. SPM9 TaxID=2975598 RepID=UPI0021A4BD3D|nr:hypothetical protein [Psychroserpens sp. SPM9]MDG5490026.1 hypothetical protein [Psychroserpens sp. SPM9]
MTYLRFLFLILPGVLVAQSQIGLTKIDSTVLKADQVIAIDNFETTYYTANTIFYKKAKDQTAVNYSNVQLGVPTTVNVFNPLKINLFYQDFNTVIILDNRLAEIFKIDFNTKQPYKNISHISTGYDNTLWIFNQDLQQLQLYDYKTDKIRATTVPVQSRVLDLKSDYNSCWMLTEKYLYQYTYFGSLISKIENKGYSALAIHNENIILKAENSLYYKSKKSETIIPLKTPKLLINQFLLTNETLYIYDSKILHKYQLKIE